MLFDEITSRISKVNNQYFYSELVGVYLIETSDILYMIDLPQYSEELKACLLRKKRPIKVFLTHGSTGIKEGDAWRQQIENFEIYLHEYDRDQSWLQIKPDKLFSCGDSLEVQKDLLAIHTPGHSKGSTCYLYKNTLFTGDVLYKKAEKPVLDRDTDAETLSALLKHNFERVLPFHHSPILFNAKKELERLQT